MRSESAPFVRPRPELLDAGYAYWCDEARAYVMRVKTSPRRGVCPGFRCRHDARFNVGLCAKCRKRLWRLNNPVADRYAHIRARAAKRRQDFEITVSYLRDLVMASPLCEAFFRMPREFHIDRENPLLGYVPGNVRVLSSRENLSKSASDRLTHQGAQFLDGVECPF